MALSSSSSSSSTSSSRTTEQQVVPLLDYTLPSMTPQQSIQAQQTVTTTWL
jgi:hypothetical protein